MCPMIVCISGPTKPGSIPVVSQMFVNILSCEEEMLISPFDIVSEYKYIVSCKLEV